MNKLVNQLKRRRNLSRQAFPARSQIPRARSFPAQPFQFREQTLTGQLLTNDNGEFIFTNVPAEELSLKFESSGFEAKEITVSAREGRETVANYALEPAEVFVALGGVMVSIAYEQPLHQAVANGELEVVTSLIANGADVNATDKNYQEITALFVAVENGNLEIAEMLLNAGAKINVVDENKRTPLLALDYNSTPELIRLLVRHGADLSAVDDSGNNILHMAAENDSAEIIELLIKEGVALDAKNDEGQTPLMIAAYYENIGTVQAFLDAGANVNIRDNENETALSIAKGEEGEEAAKIVELLIQYGARE